jgi:hypothetical protein
MLTYCLIVYENHKKLILGLLLFVLVFTLLGLPFTHWSFETDDWGNIYLAIIKHIADIKKFFINIETSGCSSGTIPIQPSFFNGLLRPMTFVFYYIQHLFFGINPYGYFLVSVAVHALSTALLFYLYTLFTNIYLAFFAAAFFGFHPSIGRWLGWISAQSYQIELLLLLLIIFLLYHYLKTTQPSWYALACLIFLSNLFLREQTVVFPFWLLFACYLYRKSQQPGINRITNALYSIKFSLPFWFISFFYLGVRVSLFPLTTHANTLTFELTWQSFLKRQSERFFDFVTYASDVCGLSHLPINHQLIKGSLIVCICLALGWLFYYSTKKNYVLFAACSTLFFSWPALLMHYQPRYIYLAIPFSLLTVLLLIKFYQGHRVSSTTKKAAAFLFSCLIATNAFMNMQGAYSREKRNSIPANAFHKLAHNPITHSRAICFLCLPDQYLTVGCTQAIWLLSGDNTRPVFNISPHMKIKGQHYTELRTTHLTFKPIKQGWQCSSTNLDKLCFLAKDNDEYATVNIVLTEQILSSKPLFFTWDYEKQCFALLTN